VVQDHVGDVGSDTNSAVFVWTTRRVSWCRPSSIPAAFMTLLVILWIQFKGFAFGPGNTQGESGSSALRVSVFIDSALK
jgi:hypothetical protein